MQIQWTGLPEAPRAAARIERLAARTRGIQGVRVVARPSTHHRHGGQRVKLACRVRGRLLVATRESADLESALHESIDGLRRQLRTLRGRRRAQRTRRAEAAVEVEVET